MNVDFTDHEIKEPNFEGQKINRIDDIEAHIWRDSECSQMVSLKIKCKNDVLDQGSEGNFKYYKCTFNQIQLKRNPKTQTKYTNCRKQGHIT